MAYAKIFLSLTLFMLGVYADTIQPLLAAYQLAVHAHFFYRSTDFHP